MLADLAPDLSDIIEHRAVREAYNLHAADLKPAGAVEIVLLSIIVRRPVEFDDEQGFGAVEVEDRSLEGELPAELPPVQLTIAQPIPQELLRRRRFPPHRLGPPL